MKVIGLKVENIKKVKVVEIHPTEPVVKISGDNGAGKSTLMDAISYAIGGKRLIPDDPIRTGEDRAEVIVELDDLTAIRSFKRTEAGYTTTLKVLASGGAKYSNGQQVLDGLLGKLSFDPFEFSQMDSKAQAELLKGMVDIGLNLEEWDSQYQELYTARRDAKRDLKTAEENLSTAPKYHPDVPDQEVSVADLSSELLEINRIHQEFKELERKCDQASEYHENETGKIETIKGEIAELEASLTKKREELEGQEKYVESLYDKAVALENQVSEFGALPDPEPTQNKIDSADQVNEAVRDNANRKRLEESVKTCKKNVKGFEDDLAAHNKVKADAIRTAEYPVDGLEFAGDSLNWNGVPLDQASSGEQILISAQIGMALNPKLKILLIRNASLIGDKNFEMLTNFATEQGYQVWCEFVDTTGDVGIFLEEGEIATSTATPEPTPEDEGDPTLDLD
jgi:DNA repair exonuclease SbcCD ATPase subunit